jgi:hypothetical protein
MGFEGISERGMLKMIADAAIFLNDREEEMKRKIRVTFCNSKIEGNACFECIRYLIL